MKRLCRHRSAVHGVPRDARADPVVQENPPVKSVVETLNPTRVRLAVEVPFAELESDIKLAKKGSPPQVNVPGSGGGKAPPVFTDRGGGRPAVLDEAVNEALP